MGPCRHVRREQQVFRTTRSSKTARSSKTTRSSKKRARHQALLYQLCRPYFPENLDLILIGGATLLVRARAPPETWTTRLQSFDQPEPALVDYLFDLVIIFSNDCPKFEQSAKSMRFSYYELH
jgi:hypothetical protein